MVRLKYIHILKHKLGFQEGETKFMFFRNTQQLFDICLYTTTLIQYLVTICKTVVYASLVGHKLKIRFKDAYNTN